MREFATQLLTNENLLQSVKDMWHEMTIEKVTKEKILAFLDEQIEIINESQKLNFKRWDVLKKKVIASPTPRCSYKREIEYLKDYIPKRFDLVNDIVEKATTTSVSEKVQHFDLDFTRQIKRPTNTSHGNEGGHRGGGGGHSSSSIAEECINFVEED